MDNEPLVEEKIKDGLSLIKEMDRRNLSPQIAVWHHDADADEWKLLIALKSFDDPKDYADSYLKLVEILRDLSLKNIQTSDIQLRRTNEPIMKAFSSFMRVEGLSRIYTSSNMVNGIYIDKALIHRSTAQQPSA